MTKAKPKEFMPCEDCGQSIRKIGSRRTCLPCSDERRLENRRKRRAKKSEEISAEQ